MPKPVPLLPPRREGRKEEMVINTLQPRRGGREEEMVIIMLPFPMLIPVDDNDLKSLALAVDVVVAGSKTLVALEAAFLTGPAGLLA